MNILFLNLYDHRGGAETVFQLCCKESAERNRCYRLVLAGDRPAGNQSCHVGRYGRMMGKETFRELEGMLSEGSGAGKAVRIWALGRILWIVKRYKIDVVHLHNTHGFLIGAEELEILLKFVPVVWTFHDMWGMTGHCAYASKCTGWKDGCRVCRNRMEYPPLGKKDAAAIFEQKKTLCSREHLYRVCPSKWLYEMAADSMGNKNLFCIPNGVDFSVFNRYDKTKVRRKHGLDIHKKYLLFAAASVDNRKKGMRYLMDALKMLEDMEDMCDLELLVIGDSCRPISYRGAAARRFGYLPDQGTMNEIYAAADLFVLPSREDNFPCTALEAMASGTPVIAFRTGGIPEQLGGGAGFLVDEISPQAMAEGIREALMEDEILGETAEKAYLKCSNLFSAQKMGRAYEKLYRRAVRKFRENR